MKVQRVVVCMGITRFELGLTKEAGSAKSFAYWNFRILTQRLLFVGFCWYSQSSAGAPFPAGSNEVARHHFLTPCWAQLGHIIDNMCPYFWVSLFVSFLRWRTVNRRCNQGYAAPVSDTSWTLFWRYWATDRFAICCLSKLSVGSPFRGGSTEGTRRLF